MAVVVIGRRRISREPAPSGADSLDQLKRVFRVTVEVNDDDVEALFEHLRHCVDFRRVGHEFPDSAVGELVQSTDCRVATLVIGADDRNGQRFRAERIRKLTRRRHRERIISS